MTASLRARLLLLVLAGGMAPLALVGLWVARRGPQSGEEVLRVQLMEALEEITSTTGRNWVVLRSRLLDLAQSQDVRASVDAVADGSSGTVDDHILSRHDLSGSVTGLTFVDTTGARLDLWRDASVRAYGPGASVPVLIPLDSRPDDTAGGTLVVDVRAEALLPSDVLLSGVGGSILAAMTLEGTPILPQAIEPELLVQPRFEWRGQPWVAVSQTLQEPPLRLVLAGPAGAFTEPLRRAARTGTAALVIGALVAFLLVWVGTGRVTRGLDSLARASGAVAAGELNVHVPESGPSELRAVARAFNTMSASLERSLERATQRETLAALGEYAASLAHEVRNPITSMRLDLERAANRLDPEDSSETLVRRAIDELDRLDASVSGALKLAKSGRLDLSEIDVREPVQAAMRAADPRFVLRRATLATEVWPSGPVVARADPASLEQLVLNLLLNAADALDEGGAAHISVAETEHGVRIRVRDDGEGIPDERLAEVFQPLFSTRPEGTGLGLPVARRIARAHGGSLDLESEPGRGTTATLTLPPTTKGPF
jgi:signal transduction histidine kinase